MPNRWVQLAVQSLADTIENGIDSALADVETQEGLCVGQLTRPRVVTRSRQPDNNMTPLLQVYDSSFTMETLKCPIMKVSCEIAFSITGSTEMDDKEEFCRSYQTALVDLLIDNPKLGGEPGVSAGLIRNGQSGVAQGDSSAIRQVRLINVEVMIKGVQK